MAISNEEIKLASLARIHIEESEIEDLRSDMSAILGYLNQVKSATLDTEEEFEEKTLRNVMREDVEPIESGTYSAELISEFPNKSGDYLKVKKIL